LGHASFEEVRQVLIDFRDSTGYEDWMYYDGEDHVKRGWERLETYTHPRQLNNCYGLEVEDDR
jgi:hypothetical protein